MCTPWTIARLIRWRIGDWASCLFACKLPSDDEPDTFHPSLPHAPSETRLSEAKQDETRIYVIKPGRLSKRKSKKHTLVPVSIPTEDSEQTNNKKSSHYPTFKEEDYIVFCFKEDGTFEVVKEEKSESAHHVKYRTEPSRAVFNRKLVYGEDTETDTETDTDTDSKYDNEDMSNTDGIDFDFTNEKSYTFNDDEEGEDEESIYFDSEAPHPGIRTEAHDADSGTNSQKSSYSTSTQSQSSSSTGSFAFPVLRCEWNGSPIKMPKPEGLHLRKQKLLRMGLQCCKF
ncbi:protein BREAKING OF ASYMMETRY IN THE STOMATAL LINEAGE [Macadamia integrifolia]|uniref:protein BREAKING OF ASYMMETRY IN THE STOMATAL LINEAGE n=1 Tax=Macadamia integrifolia TaxID=60698 RepID=UPI001C4E5C3B|nr:protein BREAKING OF ASYMMETRY IN THE STOMATAL LINEAGE [Macadamia integrifolia]